MEERFSRLSENAGGLPYFHVMNALSDHALEAAFGDGRFWRQCDPVCKSVQKAIEQAETALFVRSDVGWWSQPVQLLDQRPLELNTGIDRQQQAAVWNHRSRWWSSPDGAKQSVSSSAVVGENLLVSDDYMDRPLALSREPMSEASVYEIRSPSDWARLVSSYPAHHEVSNVFWDIVPEANLAEPNWTLVACDWDGVHLSVAGYLGSAYQRINTDAGPSILAGWHPDATVWLSK